MRKRKEVARRKKRAQVPPTRWEVLALRIEAYADACVEKAFAGSGDPNHTPVIEAQHALTLAQLNEHIATLEEFYGERAQEECPSGVVVG